MHSKRKMKAVILAGGLGTRLGEETETKPKPMVEIGNKPILWHIMKIYSSYGINDFIVCLGYRGYQIKEYFFHYNLHSSDVTIEIGKEITIHQSVAEPWRITLIDTGAETMTGGRLKRIRSYLDEDTPFCMTYGDGVADVDIGKLIDFHNEHDRLATVTIVRPMARFGALTVERGIVQRFEEKPITEGGQINGGFFVLSPKALDYVEGDATIWEREPMERLVRDRQLAAYAHDGFWQPMDTLRDRKLLEGLWSSGSAPWKVWDKSE